MDVTEKVSQLVSPSLDAMGYEIVQIKLEGGERRKTLMLMAERKDGRIMGFDDCTEISRTVSALMDVEDPIPAAYNLEVCSPGIDRPLVKFDDYVRHMNYEAKIDTLIPINGRKRFRGVIAKAADNTITLRTDEGEAEITHSNIKTGKLVMTDELMRAFLKQHDKQSTDA